MIPWGEFLVGLGLILGTLTLTAAFFGLLMNFMFLFAGTVNTNPWLLLLGMLVVVAGTNAGRFGLDRYVLPLIHKGTDRLFHRKPKNPATAGHWPSSFRLRNPYQERGAPDIRGAFCARSPRDILGLGRKTL